MGGEGKGGGKSKGKGKGKAPPLPLPPPPSPGGGPGRGPSMRQLATEKVAAAQMKPGAIWTSSDTSAPVLPDSAAEIATLFGAKKTAKTKLAKTGLSNREEALVDKAQDVEIVLMKFKSKGGGGGGAEADIAMCDGVRDAILAFDSEAMDESYGFEPGTSMTLVRRLHGWYPDPRTLAQLAAYGGDMKRLLKADLFYKRLEETEGGVLMQQAMECFVICAEDRVGLQRVCSVVRSRPGWRACLRGHSNNSVLTPAGLFAGRQLPLGLRRDIRERGPEGCLRAGAQALQRNQRKQEERQCKG